MILEEETCRDDENIVTIEEDVARGLVRVTV